MENNKRSKYDIFVITIVIVMIMLVSLPWYKFNIIWPSYMFGGKVILELNYIITFVCLVFYLLLGIFNYSRYGHILNQILIDGLLISFAYNHNVSLMIPLLVVFKDLCLLNNRVKRTKMDKVSNVIIYIGFMFVFLGNIPFEFLNLAIDQGLIIVGTCIGLYNGICNLLVSKKTITNE